MKIVTRTIDGSAKMTWMPRAAKNDSNHPPRPNRSTAISPTITGDTRQREVDERDMNRRPTEPVAGQHQRDHQPEHGGHDHRDRA